MGRKGQQETDEATPMQDRRDELTFEVNPRGKGVRLDTFLAKMKGFLRALTELDAYLSDDHRRTVTWLIVEASFNSPLRVRVASKAIKDREPNKQVATAYAEGVKMLEEGTGEPEYFTPSILETTKRVLRTKSETGGPIAIYSPEGGIVRPTNKLAKNISHMLRTKFYQEYGAIEGKLDAVNAHGVPEFTIFDVLTDHPTKLHFIDADMSERAIQSLRRRVAVTGMVTYNRKDDPVSMTVDDFEVLRDSAELPRFLSGEEINITGGLDSVEYVRKSRDEDG